jgi:hypothetical protein
MIRIEISAAAYQALAGGRDPHRLLEPHRSPEGGFYLWLTRPVLDRFNHARGPGESYSDVILRMSLEDA